MFKLKFRGIGTQYSGDLTHILPGIMESKFNFKQHFIKILGYFIKMRDLISVEVIKAFITKMITQRLKNLIFNNA